MPKLNDLRVRIRDNGIRWTSYHLFATFLRSGASSLDAAMARLEEKKDLPGINHIHRNRQKWEGWDWSRNGEEWTPSEEWKTSLVACVLKKYIPAASIVLEIGPGGGRWTEHLQPLAAQLTVVDLSEHCIEHCRRRFSEARNIDFHVTDGKSLAAVEDGSVDRVWSFDVFVHISVPDTRMYVDEIARVLRPGGVAVIHHSKDGGGPDGFRSRMTEGKFADMVRAAGLKVTTQFDTWGPNEQYDVRHFGDIVTVFEKPGENGAHSDAHARLGE